MFSWQYLAINHYRLVYLNIARSPKTWLHQSTKGLVPITFLSWTGHGLVFWIVILYCFADHYWWADVEDAESHFHPHEKAPHCLPCHWTPKDEAWALRADGYKPFEGYPACPCTAEHICRHDTRGFFDESCQIPAHPKRAYRYTKHNHVIRYVFETCLNFQG